MYKEDDKSLGSNDLSRQNITGINEGSPSANVPARVLTATSIIGDKVENLSGQNVGKVNNIMLNLKSGCIEYVVLEYGGILGIGEKLFAIPFNAMRLDSLNQRFILNIRKEFLERAPGIDKNHWPGTNSEHWTSVDKYWLEYREPQEPEALL